MGVPYSIFCCFKSTTEARLIDLEAGGGGGDTYSTDVNTMLASANNDAIRSAIGVGTTDTTTFARLSLNSAVSSLYFKSATGVERGFFYTDSGGYINYRFGLSGGQFVMQGAAGVAATNNGLVWQSATELWTEGANVLAQRRGTNAQAFRVYNTFPGTTANEWFEIDWKTTANSVRIGTNHAGTGGTRQMILTGGGGSTPGFQFNVGAAATWIIDAAGAFKAGFDNTFDIGASGAKPRNIYAGTSIECGTSSFLGWTGRAKIYSPSGSNNVIQLLNNAASDFNLLILGLATSAFPAIKRNGTGIDIKLADDSTYAPLTAGSLSLGVAVPTADLDIAKTWNAPAINITGASGQGTIATIYFAVQPTPIPIGSTIVVAGVNPSGYNGTYVVVGSGAGFALYANTTTAAWVSGGTIERVFTSVKLNVTDTASNAASLLMDLQVDGVSKIKAGKNGNLLIGSIGSTSGSLFINSSSVGGATIYGSTRIQAGPLNFNGTTYLYEDAAGILAQRNARAAQMLRVYGDFIDVNNYERASFGYSGGQISVGSDAAGTGVHRKLSILGAGIDFYHAGIGIRWSINTSGHFTAATNNTYDIGAIGDNRPRTIYAGTAVVAPTVTGANFLSTSSGGAIDLGGDHRFRAPSSGVLKLSDNAETGFNRLQLGGTTSAFPAIKRNGTGIDIVLANDSALAPLAAAKLELVTAAATGVRESILKASISDNATSAFHIYNATFADGKFVPGFSGSVFDSTTTASLFFAGQTDAANDTGTSPLMIFTARTTTSTTDPNNGTHGSVTTRPLFTWWNNYIAQMQMSANGNLGIGTTTPASKLQVSAGDIEVDTIAKGVILKSPDGTRYRVTAANGGTLSVAAV